ncbi:hypothetical protein [Variovorax paradoxus]|uniref:hypothetical protein n=1 Tax=Variovorax paradoxus TaxID=34073 RepID=UPI0028634D26|nr:hypothetical protein [Variovorax paradoxus]MDR6453872.1 hypothetical protein [Variovorax paradoxus]
MGAPIEQAEGSTSILIAAGDWRTVEQRWRPANSIDEPTEAEPLTALDGKTATRERMTGLRWPPPNDTAH